MKYLGSKNRHAKELLPIILKNKDDRYYVEPFVGGFNMIDKVKGKRLGNDSHYYLIELGKALQSVWIPPNYVAEATYYEVKTQPELYEPAYVAFVGFCCSFGGKWWGGYARGVTNKGISRNYAQEAASNLLKQAPNLKNIIFSNLSYELLDIPKIVLCIVTPHTKIQVNIKILLTTIYSGIGVET